MEPDDVRLWTWRAGGHCQGVSDDLDRAKAAAEGCLAVGESAWVELAVFASGYRRLSADHVRLGCGWRVTRTRGNAMDWQEWGPEARGVGLVPTHHLKRDRTVAAGCRE